MPRKKQPERTARTSRGWTGRQKAVLLATGLLLVAAVVLIFAPRAAAWYARRRAAADLADGAITSARQWLGWAAWFNPADGRADLLEAGCFRQLNQVNEFLAALEAARQKGAPAAAVDLQMRLAQVQAGRINPGAEDEILAMIEAGLPPRDVLSAFVYGFLVRGEGGEAREILDAWAADFPDEPHVSYMRGLCRQWSDELALAQQEFETALARQPRHELARRDLAELLEQEDRLVEALRQFIAWAEWFPASDSAQAGVARILRKLGRLDEALEILQVSPGTEASPELAIERGQVELEAADYQSARQWFVRADIDRSDDRDAMLGAAVALAVGEQSEAAGRLIAEVDAATRRERRADELQLRLTLDPRDRSAAEELDRLAAPASRDTPPAGQDSTPAARLYALHCSACHGDNGDGRGPAARHLFPRPRNLRTGRSRLVSTVNAVPTIEDLEAVIRRGMPGTSMLAFDKLSEREVRLLAEETLRINREGVRQQFVELLRSEGEEIDDDEISEMVELRTTPGDLVAVPSIGPAGPQAIAAGGRAYRDLGCANCHGEDGTGVWNETLFDEDGFPSPARNLVDEPFKGGHEPAAVYLRIFAGMPGTPHPSCMTVPEEQLVDLVEYCRSLAREPRRASTNYDRSNHAARRTVSGGLPALPGAG